MINQVSINIWNREVTIDIIYDVYEGENITIEQENALNAFLENTKNEELDNPESELYNKDYARIVLSDSSRIKEYCMKTSGEFIDEDITNVFKYVMPTSLFVIRENKKRLVALLCDYRFDEEHGVALLFENEKLLEIGDQDII